MLHGADGVNRINASAAAAERGIRVQEDKREHVTGGTGATLRLSLHWSRRGGSEAEDRGDWTGLATVLHGHSPRLLSYDGIDIEAELAGTLLIIRNEDVPGVIGRIGTELGEARLNIASFALGRRGSRAQRGHISAKGRPWLWCRSMGRSGGAPAGSGTAPGCARDPQCARR